MEAWNSGWDSGALAWQHGTLGATLGLCACGACLQGLSPRGDQLPLKHEPRGTAWQCLNVAVYIPTWLCAFCFWHFHAHRHLATSPVHMPSIPRVPCVSMLGSLLVDRDIGHQHCLWTGTLVISSVVEMELQEQMLADTGRTVGTLVAPR